MSEQQKSGWLMLTETVTGHSHELTNKPNQDSILCKGLQDGTIVMMAVADGHGSKAYFRSDRGAHLAVEVAIQEMEACIKPFQPQLQSPIKYFGMIDHHLKQLPASIVKKWRDAVYKDWQEYYGDLKDRARQTKDPVLEEELNTAQQIEQQNAKQPTKPYGTTLLGVLVTPSFIFSFQIGDGDILSITSDMRTQRIVQGDTRLLANETTSLCAPHAVNDFRLKLDWLDHKSIITPELIMLSTDGYANSFNTEQDFFQVGPDIIKALRSREVDEIKHDIKFWLKAATEKGSGDDITLGLLWNPYVSVTTGVKQGTSDQEHPQDQPSKSQLDKGPPLYIGREYVQQVPLKEDNDIIAKLVQPILHVSPQISPDKPDHFSTISEALNHANKKAVIYVYSGTYHESLHITQNVFIKCRPNDGPVILTGPVPCLSLSAPEITIQGLTIQGQGDPKTDIPAVDIYAGNATLDHCDITSTSKIGVLVRGLDTQATFHTGQIHDNAGFGMRIIHHARANLDNIQIHHNKFTGLQIVESDEQYNIQEEGYLHIPTESTSKDGVHILNCQICNNNGAGIILFDSGLVSIIRSEISSNQGPGVLTQGASEVRADQCAFRSGKSSGLAFELNSKGILADCEIQHNAVAGLEIDHAEVTLKKCYLEQKESTDIHIFSEGKGVVIKSHTIAGQHPHTTPTQYNSPIYLQEMDIRHKQHKLSSIILDDCTGTISDVSSKAQAAGLELANYAQLTHLRNTFLHEPVPSLLTSYALTLKQSSRIIINHQSLLETHFVTVKEDGS